MPISTSWVDNVGQIVNAAFLNALGTLVNSLETSVSSINTALASKQPLNSNLTTWATKTPPTGTAVGTSDTQTLTLKRITPRVATVASSATPTINTDVADTVVISALAVNISNMSTNLSGSPSSEDPLRFAITGTAARTISWGTSFENGAATLPSTTTTTQRLDVGFFWNNATSKWRCMAVASA